MVPIGGVGGSSSAASRPVNAAKDAFIFESEEKTKYGKRKTMTVQIGETLYTLDTDFNKKGKTVSCSIDKSTSTAPGWKAVNIRSSSDPDELKGDFVLDSTKDFPLRHSNDRKGTLNAAEKEGLLLAKEVYSKLLLAGKRTEDPQMRAIRQFIINARALATA